MTYNNVIVFTTSASPFLFFGCNELKFSHFPLDQWFRFQIVMSVRYFLGVLGKLYGTCNMSIFHPNAPRSTSACLRCIISTRNIISLTVSY